MLYFILYCINITNNVIFFYIDSSQGSVAISATYNMSVANPVQLERMVAKYVEELEKSITTKIVNLMEEKKEHDDAMTKKN